jgi:hypothetical protein
MLLDHAEALAEHTGAATLQEYCAELLARAIEVERVKHHMTEVEARRGPLEGFNEIAEDPDYLAEWQERSGSNETTAAKSAGGDTSGLPETPELTVPVESLGNLVIPEPPEITFLEQDPDPPADGHASDSPAESEPGDRPRIRITPARPAAGPRITERIEPEVLDRTAIDIVRTHVGPGGDDPSAFLPSMRSGRASPPEKVAELLAALRRIEVEERDSSALDRGLSYALHRLSMESQVLLTEAWPGVFDDRTVSDIRAVQEMVERILSGQDIRYYSTGQGQVQNRSEARE